VIASLTGTVLELKVGQITLVVNGVGYLIHSTPATTSGLAIGSSVTLRTALVVREDSLALFGFLEQREQEIFELLLSVSGVGPKSALAVMSQMSVNEIAAAVATDDDAAFKAVTGIGSKTAKLIALSLAGKFEGHSESRSENTNALAALLGLGWSEKQARAALAEVGQSDLSDSQLLKKALSILGGEK
jgi:holliday junction DNA helicase RuvA